MSWQLSESDIKEIKEQAVAEYLLEHSEILKNRWHLCDEELPENVDHWADGKKKNQYLVETKHGRLEVAEYVEIYEKPFWMSHYACEVQDVIKWQLLS